jgi:hypothetical protein
MPLPDAEHAIVTEEKVCEYLLNPSHPMGGPEAVWFASIGYALHNAKDLAFVDGDGTTVAIMTLDADDIRPIGAGELLHARRCGLAEPGDAAERE